MPSPEGYTQNCKIIILKAIITYWVLPVCQELCQVIGMESESDSWLWIVRGWSRYWGDGYEWDTVSFLKELTASWGRQTTNPAACYISSSRTQGVYKPSFLGGFFWWKTFYQNLYWIPQVFHRLVALWRSSLWVPLCPSSAQVQALKIFARQSQLHPQA